KEKYLRDRRRSGGNAGKAQYGGNDCNHEKYDGVVKHGVSPSIVIGPFLVDAFTASTILIEEFLYLALCLFAGPPVPLLNQSGQTLGAALYFGQIVVGKIAPRDLGLAGKLFPLSFESVFVHRVLLV